MALKIKKNDTVEVITGKSRGKQGRVLRVFPETQKVLVEGVNIMKKHERPSQKNQQGGITERAFPIHISNVMLLDPKTSEKTRVGRRKVDGVKGTERFAKKSGDALV